jgi:hypothetical protein
MQGWRQGHRHSPAETRWSRLPSPKSPILGPTHPHCIHTHIGPTLGPTREGRRGLGDALTAFMQGRYG